MPPRSSPPTRPSPASSAPAAPGTGTSTSPGSSPRSSPPPASARIETLGRDTYAGDYFSYRRSVHAGEPDYGRNLSLIALDR